MLDIFSSNMDSSSVTRMQSLLVGIALIVTSLACVFPNVVVMHAIYRDSELLRYNAYKFMFVLGIFDIAQLVPHAITGIFTIWPSTCIPAFAKACGVIATPSYVAYAVLTVVLSINRLTQICAPHLDAILFSPKGMKVWYGVGGFFFFVFAAALASPWAAIVYIPELWSWSYDFEYSGSRIVQNVEMVIELGGIPISGVIYVIVFFQIITQRKKFATTSNYRTDVKILIQAGVITFYCSVLNFLWHEYSLILPENIYIYGGLNFMWVINSAINPIVYYAVNSSIRKNARSSIQAKSTILIGRKSQISTANTFITHPQTTRSFMPVVRMA